MPRSYAENYERKRESLSEAVSAGEVSERDAEAIRAVVDAFDEHRPSASRPSWPDAPSRLTQYRAKSTLANWFYFLTAYAKQLTLTDTTADELNRLAGKMLRGELESVKDDGLTKGSIRAYQNTARIFYRFHDDLGVEYTDIEVFDQESTSVDATDMLTPEEVERVRQAPDNPRDRAVVYLLLYTGVRNNALRTLRVGDIDLDNERFYFNTDADGLKNISRPREPRPLLGSVAAVREWLRYHPAPDDDEAYLITARSKFNNPDPHEQVSDRTIARIMESVKEKADIDKPLHPHMMRHNHVSILKREYGMDDDAVKFLIGHKPDSTVMSTTYAHLSGEDYAQKAEVAAGIREETESSFSPEEYCSACGEPLPDGAKACASCGTVFTPDARDVEDRLEDDATETMVDADDREVREAAKKVKDLVDENPELLDVLIEERQDSSGS